MQVYYVYILTKKYNTALYTGVTRDLIKRVYQHKNNLIKGFTQKYNVDKLVYYESFNSPIDAISAEKKIKGWTRAKKIALIKFKNPKFEDLII